MIADIQLGLNLHFEMKRNAFFGFRQLKARATAAMAEVTLPDPAAGRTSRQLGVCWGPGNFLLLHVKKSKAEQQRLGGGSGEESKVHEVRWETTLYEPVFRKLVNESFGIFLSLQKLAEEEAGVVSLSTGEKNNIEKHEISNALL